MSETVLITGASGGLGYEFARLFSKDSYDLLLIARSEEKLKQIKEALEKEFGNKVTVLAKDLSEENAAKEVFDFTIANNIQIDCLVNNAGYGDCGEFALSDLNRQVNMINLNVLTLIKMTRLFMEGMLARKKGRILNVASIAGFFPGPYMSVYYASKAFVLSFTEAISEELKGSGLYVSALCPGPAGTQFFNVANGKKMTMFKFIKLADPQKVALAGYKRLFKNKVITLPCGARSMANFAKLLTHGQIRSIIAKLQKTRK